MFKSKIISNVLILIFILILILILFYQYRIENFSMRNAVFDITDKETQELITVNLTNIINNHTNLIERINEKNEERRLIRTKIREYNEIKKTIRNREYLIINKQDEIAKQKEELDDMEQLKTNKLKEIEIGFPDLDSLIKNYTNDINSKNNEINSLNFQININQSKINRKKRDNIFLRNIINNLINRISNLNKYRYEFNSNYANWYNHQNEARRRGGNLTTIINKKEYDEVRRVSGYRRIFIGAIRRYTPQWYSRWLNTNRSFRLGWKWITDSGNFNVYSKFAGGEPNNWGNIEQVLELYSNGYYNDIPWWVGRQAVYKIPNYSYQSNLSNLTNQKSSLTTYKVNILNQIKTLSQDKINKEKQIRILNQNIKNLKKNRRTERIKLTGNLRKLNYDLNVIKDDISDKKEKIKTNENIINNNDQYINEQLLKKSQLITEIRNRRKELKLFYANIKTARLDLSSIIKKYKLEEKPIIKLKHIKNELKHYEQIFNKFKETHKIYIPLFHKLKELKKYKMDNNKDELTNRNKVWIEFRKSELIDENKKYCDNLKNINFLDKVEFKDCLEKNCKLNNSKCFEDVCKIKLIDDEVVDTGDRIYVNDKCYQQTKKDIPYL
jgi:chromosome segregation ATPase